MAVLADPLLQKLMLLRPDSESEQRLANWLNGVLQDVRDGDADEDTFFDMLDILREYVVSIKVCFLLAWLRVNLTRSRTSLLSYLTSLHAFFRFGMDLDVTMPWLRSYLTPHYWTSKASISRSRLPRYANTLQSCTNTSSNPLKLQPLIIPRNLC